MIKINRLILYSAVVVFIGATSCSEDSEPQKAELSDFAKNFLGLRLGSSQALSRANGRAINGSFNNLMGSSAARSSANVSDFAYPADSTDGKIDPDIYYEPWVTCAVVTTTLNDDGSTTTINDYGTNGCEEGNSEYKYFMHGKFTETYKYQSEDVNNVNTNSYSYKTIFDNYGGHYGDETYSWSLDGQSEYTGESTYDYDNNTFSGSYSYNDNSIYKYDGYVYAYISNGKSSYNEISSTVHENYYKYSDDSSSYSSEVIKPLVTKYNCSSADSSNSSDSIGTEFRMANRGYVWAPVSGKERIKYLQGGQSGSFEIDYGNGECDNIVYITENGVTVEVDLSEQLMVRTDVEYSK